MSPKDADGMANGVDLDLGLHCLPKPICPIITVIPLNRINFTAVYKLAVLHLLQQYSIYYGMISALLNTILVLNLPSSRI